jgi:hypothetical protein
LNYHATYKISYWSKTNIERIRCIIVEKNKKEKVVVDLTAACAAVAADAFWLCACVKIYDVQIETFLICHLAGRLRRHIFKHSEAFFIFLYVLLPTLVKCSNLLI